MKSPASSIKSHYLCDQMCALSDSINCFWVIRQLIELYYEIYEGVDNIVLYFLKFSRKKKQI